MEDLKQDTEEWYESPLTLAIVFASTILLAIVVGVLLGGWYAVEVGAFGVAADLATYASAFGTFGLLVITGFYSYQTWLLVDETREARKQEIKLRERDEEKRKTKLRRALMEEIEMTTKWVDDRLEKEAFHDAQASFPTIVFESVIDDLGLLPDEEMRAILNFYTNALALKGAIEVRRKGESVPDDYIMKSMVQVSEIGKQAQEALDESLPEDG